MTIFQYAKTVEQCGYDIAIVIVIVALMRGLGRVSFGFGYSEVDPL